MNLSSHRTLILNSTFQPLSVVSFKRAISLMHNKKINAIKNSEIILHSEKEEFFVPKVGILTYFVKAPFARRVALNRENIFIRDFFRYPKGQAEMKLEKITAQSGFKTPLHLHPQPGIIYVQRGTLFCEASDGKSLTVGAGESFASPQDTVHYCENNGDEEMVVFVASAGVKGKKTTVPTE